MSNSQGQPELIEVNGKWLREFDRLPAGEHTTTVRQGGSKGEGLALAHVHVDRDAYGAGPRGARPPFTLNEPSAGGLFCSVRPVGDGTYDVYGSDGATLGRITRRGGGVLPWPRRVRWTVEGAGAVGGSLTGAVGTRRGWVSAIVTAPVVLVVWLAWNAWALAHLLLGVEEFRKHYWPWSLSANRTRWRGNGTDDSIEYRSWRYRLDGQRLDRRLAYAQAVLHTWDIRPAG